MSVLAIYTGSVIQTRRMTSPREELSVDSTAMPRTRQRRAGPPSLGARLTAIHLAKDVTQVELTKAIGSSQRNISYYESEKGQTPALVLSKIAEALGVSTDEILGVRPTRAKKSKAETPRNQQLWKRFQLLVELPDRDQKAVMRMISSLAIANGLVRRPGKEGTSSR